MRELHGAKQRLAAVAEHQAHRVRPVTLGTGQKARPSAEQPHQDPDEEQHAAQHHQVQVQLAHSLPLAPVRTWFFRPRTGRTANRFKEHYGPVGSSPGDPEQQPGAPSGESVGSSSDANDQTCVRRITP
jgi:hypothetical protein